MTTNQLDNETSPYLLQHKDNPVHWRPWGADALAEARRQNKPILLSVGYSACHWCHVMAHESFEDGAIAALMNQHFVNIKVDREERPDIDGIYQTSLALLGQHGGWPLTMFLTPDAAPFWGGTYFPASSLYGRPAFADVLTDIAETYRAAPDKVASNAKALCDGLARLTDQPPGEGLSMDRLDAAARLAVGIVDTRRGGTTGAPKFPQPAFFRFLWRAYLRHGSADLRDAVTVTLDNICQGGIYDHLGGGFARYSTDDDWLVPHFEKMLYDNALLVDLLTEVWLETASDLYAARVRETIDWCLAEMSVGDARGGAFAAAFDADSEGVEGKFYVWSEAEVDALLGADSEAFKTAYDVTPGGNWEGNTILNRSHALELGDGAAEARLEDCRGRLLGARRQRIPPGRDAKALTDWNGLMIAAMARAGAVFGEPSWCIEAEAAFAFVAERMTADGRLFHTWCAGRARHGAVLDDYGAMARAGIVLFEVTGKNSYLDQARAWIEVAEDLHRDADGGGYFFTPDDADDVISRSKTAQDNATPSGNGLMVEVLARLFHLTGELVYRDRAAATVAAMAGATPDQQINQPFLLSAFELLEEALQVVVIGTSGDAATETLLDAARAAPAPLAALLHLAPGETTAPHHPAAGKDAVDGAATAYVCRGHTCGLPVTDAAALRAQLRTRLPA